MLQLAPGTKRAIVPDIFKMLQGAVGPCNLLVPNYLFCLAGDSPVEANHQIDLDSAALY